MTSNMLLVICLCIGLVLVHSNEELYLKAPTEFPSVAIFSFLFDNKNPKMAHRSSASFIGTLQHFRRRSPEIPIFLFLDRGIPMRHFICQLSICVFREDMQQTIDDFHYLHQSVNPLVYEYYCFLRWPLYSAYIKQKYGGTGSAPLPHDSFVFSLDLDIAISYPLENFVEKYLIGPGVDHSVISNGGFEVFRASKLVSFGDFVEDLYRENNRVALRKFVLEHGDHKMAHYFKAKNLTIHSQVTGPGAGDEEGLRAAAATAITAADGVRDGSVRHEALIHFSDMYLLTSIEGTTHPGHVKGGMEACPMASIVGADVACTKDGKIFKCTRSEVDPRYDFIAEACYAHFGGVMKKHLHTFFMCLEHGMQCSPADYNSAAMA